MTNNNHISTNINVWDAIKSGLFDNKLELFNRLYPENQCNDWTYDDSSWDFDDNIWTLYFIKWERAEKGKIFKTVMGYWSPFIRPGLLDENSKIEKIDETSKDYDPRKERGVYVYKWEQDRESFKLSLCDPTTKPWPTHTGFSKCSLKRHEALVICYGNFEKFSKENIDIDINLFKQLMDRTHELLSKRCNSLVKVATQKRFKRGWVFYKMKEDYLALEKLWKPHGFYYKISNDIARAYSYKYNSIHPDDLADALASKWDLDFY